MATDPIDGILSRYVEVTGNLISLLQEVQSHFGYLPKDALYSLAKKTGIPITRLYSIATFYHFFSLKPKGRHEIQVCTGTACHVKGAARILDDLKRKLAIGVGETTPDGQFTLNEVHCVGACAFAPVVVVGGRTHGEVSPQKLSGILSKHAAAVGGEDGEPAARSLAAKGSELLPEQTVSRSINVRVCMGLGGVAAGGAAVLQAFREILAEKGLSATFGKKCVDQVGCMGFCAKDVIVEVRIDGVLTVYQFVKPDMVSRIVEEHILSGIPVQEWLAGPEYEQFHRRQNKVVLGACGTIDPEDIDAYCAIGGYESANRAISSMTPEKVIEEIKASGLKGRGGAGFPTGLKWELCRRAPGNTKYLICNADEGDPGAFMDRAVIEGDPHAVIEGMIIAAYAIGASKGYVYIRAEYPLAVQRLRQAIAQARDRGYLGTNVPGHGLGFDIQIKLGAGAFVCGEETALIASLEDQIGEPKPKPPFPVDKGLWGLPTCINNVETLATIPKIIKNGAAWLAAIGTGKSKGTKIFSLVGKINRSGLVEVPMGMPLREIIYEIGGGIPKNKKFKAVQTGGPSGGCIFAAHLDVPVDYENLTAVGSIMGSGGMVVMDENTCMVDVAKYFVSFCVDESCGQCTPCREGTRELSRLLNDITTGKGTPEHLTALEELSAVMRDMSLCALGKTAPNPVLSTLRYFRDEYEAHIYQKKCPAGVCQELALSPCENSCPLRMNIPRFLDLYQEGRLEDAFESVVMDNPLPASTGRVCQHPCGTRCRRQALDEGVNMREVHRFIADSVYQSKLYEGMAERILKRRLEPTGHKVAVAGAGPTGLTAAFYLAMLGHDVTVFEERSEAGGMLRFAIPEYRLPKAVLRRELDLIEGVGVKFVFNTRVGFDLPLNDLAANFDAVFISIGTWKESWLYLPGTELKNVHPALIFLEAVARREKVPIGSRVVIIGGGNAAIDSARTVLRMGANATILYRRERKDMPAIDEEIQAAEEEGVRFVFLAAPHHILGGTDGSVKAIEIVKTRLGEYDKSGRRRPIPTDEVQRFECDSVIPAVGETCDMDFCRASGLELKEDGTIVVDRFTFETSRSGFYAGGDVITGASNMSNAMSGGKQAARKIDERIMGDEQRWEQLFPEFEYSHQAPGESSLSHRHEGHTVAVKARVRSHQEVVAGLSQEEALEECQRCLRCDLHVPADIH
jgi:NADH-quinone oxidoreductase subunit F